jgi:hypothetical protein
MKVDAATKIWAGSASTAAAAIFLCAFLRATGALGAFTLIPVFVVAIVLLVLIAVKLAAARPRLNLTIAAESIIALGIFSLILSLIVALHGVSEFVEDAARRSLTIEDINRFTVPFIEGLAAAGIAPFIATILRHFEASFAAIESGETGMTEAAREATVLAKELKNATAIITSINKELMKTKDAFESAFMGALEGVAGLGTTLQTETERLKFALQRVQAEATALSDASEKSRTAVSAFGTSMVGLTASSSDARELLDALGKLIDSVERYVRPDR